jgi:hypothetical protein
MLSSDHGARPATGCNRHETHVRGPEVFAAKTLKSLVM